MNSDPENNPTAQSHGAVVAFVLIGLRGAGKSTIGRQLAARIGGVFVDLDDRTAESLGEPTAGQALQIHGQQAFRQAEAQQLKHTLAAITASNRRVVLSLGGGTPTAPTAADQLRNFRNTTASCIIYLRATPHTLRSRLKHTNLADRPSLTAAGDGGGGGDGAKAEQTLDEIDNIFNQRDALYRSLAEVLDIDDLAPDEVVDRLATMLAAG